MNSDKKWGIITAAIIAAMLLVASVTFLGKDCDNCISGWQVLKLEGTSFWLSNLLFTGVGLGLIWLFKKLYNKTLDLGATRQFLIAAVLFLGLAWVRGCEDKANNGVGLKNRPNQELPDSNRIPAENLLPKVDTTK